MGNAFLSEGDWLFVTLIACRGHMNVGLSKTHRQHLSSVVSNTSEVKFHISWLDEACLLHENVDGKADDGRSDKIEQDDLQHKFS